MKLTVTPAIPLIFRWFIVRKSRIICRHTDGKQESFQMVKSLLNAVNKMLSHDDVGKLLLRLAVGGLMLFHGLHKLFDGVDGISGMLVAKGLPGLSPTACWWEVVAPCLLILGSLPARRRWCWRLR
jgi:hypothetical protein